MPQIVPRLAEDSPLSCPFLQMRAAASAAVVATKGHSSYYQLAFCPIGISIGQSTLRRANQCADKRRRRLRWCEMAMLPPRDNTTTITATATQTATATTMNYDPWRFYSLWAIKSGLPLSACRLLARKIIKMIFISWLDPSQLALTTEAQ